MSSERQHPSGQIDAARDASENRLTLTGSFGVDDLTRLVKALNDLPDETPLRVDLSGAKRIDTSIGWALALKRNRVTDAGAAFEIDGANEDIAQIIEEVTEALPKPDPPPPPVNRFRVAIEGVGRGVAEFGATFREFAGFLGLFLVRLTQSLIHPRRFRMTALIHHCQSAGLGAVPIVTLMSFLIGIVLAFQGAMQLQEFGAEIYVVDLITISIVRELGILLTAVVVAGRTASAYTAAIGSMKMREEIDAMRTLGIDPAEALIVPRVLALVLMLPILGLLSNVSGIVGGALMAWIDLGVSPSMFRIRMIEATDLSNVVVGMVKAPVFALIIGLIGCQAGMMVGSTAESLGDMTSKAVVAAIFAVIVVDAVFSVFFAQIGW